MLAHWTQDAFVKEEIRSLVDENVSLALVDRLMARIARRYGRQRYRKPGRNLIARDLGPTLPEAA
jgi:hypothetical protein